MPTNFPRTLLWSFICVALLSIFHPLQADEIALPKTDTELRGEILVESEGHALFLKNDGQLVFVLSDDLPEKGTPAEENEPLKKKEIAAQLLEELPGGFKIHTEDHYIIAYQTGRNYAKWIGNLYEGKLRRKFRLFWKNSKFRIKVQEPRFPLVAIIFADRNSYAAWAQRKTELGQPPDGVAAYYNLMTNRVAMFDFTASQRSGQDFNRDIDKILQDPRGAHMVSTIIHEGTHQLMFNSGLQTRLADTPVWLNEGIAMFFETPDFGKRQGWRGPGKTNYDRLGSMLRYIKVRPQDSLETLLATDQRLQSSGLEVEQSYAESWALIHFLVNREPAKFSKYLMYLTEKKPLVRDTPQSRIDDFKTFFGDDLAQLDGKFINYVKKLK